MVVGPQITAEEAEADLRAAGYEPLEPYPMHVRELWKVRCSTCGYEWTLNLNKVRTGQRCNHVRTTPKAAVEELLALGFEPLEEYPGRRDTPWLMRCVECKKPRRVRLANVKGRGPCSCVEKRKQAEAELRAAGYEPLDPFPGMVRKPWRSRCVECGSERRPSIDTLRQGRGRCKHMDSRLR
ncbi:hypothetical protein EV284_3500 [Streptomyces sp. BK022]|uniref:hypothetical protein n=1 Tax=Streptomyces sp. BK022 TaxID=2512123 RepID=UPI001029EE13|nr:hypothetical protein [Streptomyces sp. BK022]RZU36017.1 hypothetical protein EV284_3500 [Streptomyces sp. BK022]